MTGTNRDLFTYKSSRSYLNHLVSTSDRWYSGNNLYSKAKAGNPFSKYIQLLKSSIKKLHVTAFRSFKYTSRVAFFSTVRSIG